jgi:hypothetical protein
MGEENTMKMTEDLAHAILDVEDVCFSEGLGTETDARGEAWSELVKEAVDFVDREPYSYGVPKWRTD